ncbi:DUF3089 domain-containing protein [Yunchengibacter salinarum]|uniref:DUF3089 domain-containing protein n=1 Tax=Yunchengibacter salinarum TaxID=3133399 RepID=UPI0035B68A60
MNQSVKRRSPAAWFLIIVAIAVLVGVGLWLWVQMNPLTAMRLAYLPDGAIAEEEMAPAPDYAAQAAWAARPGMESPATEIPEGTARTAVVPAADVFYIHPTTYLKDDRWNAPLDDRDANRWLNRLVLRHQASAFNLAGRVFVPRYRQAVFGAFLDDSGQGGQAIMNAYPDVARAFDHFIEKEAGDRPIILAGHSQGAMHLKRLLAEKVVGTKLMDRLVAAYAIGDTVSVERDVGALEGIDVCTGPTDTGCLVSWLTFAPDGDPSMLLDFFNATPGLDGAKRAGSTLLCTNPLTFTPGGAAEKDANRGAIALDMDSDRLGPPVEGYTGARCGDDGILYLTRAPGDAWQDYVMPGGNFHVYDINLFYMNLRANAVSRVQAWTAAATPQGENADQKGPDAP